MIVNVSIERVTVPDGGTVADRTLHNAIAAAVQTGIERRFVERPLSAATARTISRAVAVEVAARCSRG